MAIDVSKLLGLFETLMKIVECLQQMQPTERARLLRMVEKLSGQEGLAAELEAIVSE